MHKEALHPGKPQTIPFMNWPHHLWWTLVHRLSRGVGGMGVSAGRGILKGLPSNDQPSEPALLNIFIIAPGVHT
jgi:hypothetical protein